MSRLRETYVWLKGWATKEAVVWVDPETNEEIIEHWDRRELWHVFKPHWFHTILTTKAECGCRKRFGIWPVLTCTDHLPNWLAS